MRLVIFESRAKEILISMLEDYVKELIVVPIVEEKIVLHNEEMKQFLHQWNFRPPDYFIFLNGSGVKYIFEVLQSINQVAPFLTLLKNASIIVRGPKPAGVLQQYGIISYNIIPQPHTSDMVIKYFNEKDLNEKVIVLQHYGEKNEVLSTALGKRGAQVQDLCPYKWELPDNTYYIQEIINRLIEKNVDYVVFTSSIQIQHLYKLVNKHEKAFLTDALNSMFVVSIGPVCSKTLLSYGVKVSYEVNPPKIYQLVDFIKKKIILS